MSDERFESLAEYIRLAQETDGLTYEDVVGELVNTAAAILGAERELGPIEAIRKVGEGASAMSADMEATVDIEQARHGVPLSLEWDGVKISQKIGGNI